MGEGGDVVVMWWCGVVSRASEVCVVCVDLGLGLLVCLGA